MAFRVVIPARYHSSRLPGKVLLDIAGKPMLQHVYERALESGAESVVIATDNLQVKTIAEQFGAHCCITQAHHQSGTNRLTEVVALQGYAPDDIIVNVQADEPLIPALLIRQVAEDLLAEQQAKVSSLYKPLGSMDDLFNPNKVKVVLNQQGYALYFSRAPLPWDRDHFTFPPNKTQVLTNLYWMHIGLYAYRASFLPTYSQWAASPLEQIEKLEQLRVLWYGEKIHMTLATQAVAGDVNTAEDLQALRQLMTQH